MIIKEIHGDLVKMFKRGELEVDGIAHGANCQSIMGAGIAATIREEFPAAYQADIDFGYKPNNRIGHYSEADVLNGKKVYNLYTQFNPGPNAKYVNVMQCFENLNFSNPNKTIAIPLIGCGIGGLKWEAVREIINEVTPDLDIIVVHFKKEEECNNLLNLI